MSDAPESEEQEGTGTLSAQFTRKAVDKITGAIRREREKGTPEDVIAKTLAKRFSDYDEHSRGLLLKLAGTAPIPDDFSKDIVLDSQQPKPNTLILKLTAAPPDINLYSLIRYDGKEWLIVEHKGATVTMKLL